MKMLLNLWDWTEQPDGSRTAQHNGIYLAMEQVWDNMLERWSWEYRFFQPGGGNGGGVAASADVEEAKREAERLASWLPGSRRDD